MTDSPQVPEAPGPEGAIPPPPPPPPPPADGGYFTPPAQPPPGYAPGYGAPGPVPPGSVPPGSVPPGYGPAYPLPGYPAGYPMVDPTLKSRLVAGLLGVFLGGFGVHRFYLGYNGIAVVQIIVTLVTCGVGAIWGLIEGILILAETGITQDAAGRPLRE